MLTARNLTVTYPGQDFAILSNLTFDMPKGNALWLKGANGSGKTTLLYSLCNIIPQEIPAARSGDVILDDSILNDLPLNMLTPRLSIAMSNPNWELFFSHPLEELVFVLENIGLEQQEIKTRIDSVCAAFDLAKIMDLQSGKLSEGWKKMVSLAVHAAVNPQVLLLDEPLSGLSESNTGKVITWLKSYLAEGGILILAEHNDAVMELTPQILSLEK